jgi:hypothetical protein
MAWAHLPKINPGECCEHWVAGLRRNYRNKRAGKQAFCPFFKYLVQGKFAVRFNNNKVIQHLHMLALTVFGFEIYGIGTGR